VDTLEVEDTDLVLLAEEMVFQTHGEHIILLVDVVAKESMVSQAAAEAEEELVALDHQVADKEETLFEITLE
jgi:hypothetical protein